MTADDIANLSYLSLLGIAIAGYFIIANRNALGRMIQFAALWGMIFIGVVASAGLWDDLQSRVVPRQAVFASEGRIEVPRSSDGHYYLTLTIDNTPVRFVVDTGATDIVLSRQDAVRLGYDMKNLGFIGSAQTANGRVRTARVKLKNVQVGDITDGSLSAWVNEGEMDKSLLGMAYINRFNRIEIADSKLVLTR